RSPSRRISAGSSAQNGQVIGVLPGSAGFQPARNEEARMAALPGGEPGRSWLGGGGPGWREPDLGQMLQVGPPGPAVHHAGQGDAVFLDVSLDVYGGDAAVAVGQRHDLGHADIWAKGVYG